MNIEMKIHTGNPEADDLKRTLEQLGVAIRDMVKHGTLEHGIEFGTKAGDGRRFAHIKIT